MNIKNPKDNGNGTYDCELEHPVYGWIPFTASLDDPESLGRDIHAAIASGVAGSIQPHQPPTTDELAAIARGERDHLLAGFDTELYRNQFFWSTLTTEQQAERLAYRQALLDVPQQAGFQIDIIWPAYPTL